MLLALLLWYHNPQFYLIFGYVLYALALTGVWDLSSTGSQVSLIRPFSSTSANIEDSQVGQVRIMPEQCPITSKRRVAQEGQAKGFFYFAIFILLFPIECAVRNSGLSIGSGNFREQTHSADEWVRITWGEVLPSQTQFITIENGAILIVDNN